MGRKLWHLFLFANFLVGRALSIQFNINVHPMNFKGNDPDGTVYLKIDPDSLFEDPGPTICTGTEKGPYGDNGYITTQGPDTTSFNVTFSLAKNAQLKAREPKTATFQLNFKNKDCEDNNEGTIDIYNAGLYPKERVFKGGNDPLVSFNRCELSVEVPLSFDGCQNWHGNEKEGPVFTLMVPVKEDEVAQFAKTYRFDKCSSFIKFFYPLSKMRKLAPGITYIEDCEYEERDGACQICTTPAPVTLQPVNPEPTPLPPPPPSGVAIAGLTFALIATLLGLVNIFFFWRAGRSNTPEDFAEGSAINDATP